MAQSWRTTTKITVSRSRDDGRETVGDLGRHALRHFDDDVVFDEQIIDQRHHDAQQHGGEQARRAEIAGGDGGRHRRVALAHAGGDDQQEHQQRDQAGQGGLVLAFQLVRHGLADAEHRIQGDHVGGVGGDHRDDRFQADVGDKGLVGFNVQPRQKRGDGAHHDDGQKRRKTAADGAQDLAGRELVGDRDQAFFHGRLEFFHHNNIPPGRAPQGGNTALAGMRFPRRSAVSNGVACPAGTTAGVFPAGVRALHIRPSTPSV